MGVSEGTMSISRFEPERLVEFNGRMGRMAPRVTNICEPDAQGTQVIRRVELEPPGIMRLMSPLVASKIGRDNDRFLANLKSLLEGAGPQA
jgi:Polyketide cyclase / dehydrase and lipid transport